MASDGKEELDLLVSESITTKDNSEKKVDATPLKENEVNKDKISTDVTPTHSTLVTSTSTPPTCTSTSEFQFTPPNPPLLKPSSSTATHPNEDDNLKFIQEQLNFLNNESGELATPIHMSNKQKRLELAKKHQELAAKRKDLRSPAKQFLKIHSRGIKRSPQKPIKPRKPKRVRRSIGFAEKSPDKGHSSGAEADTSEDDSTDEENWKIIDESSDNEIDKALEENAAKQNLTVVNVKNILHQVITNEDVVAMVKNTLNEIAEESSSILIPATYEPKMTRSKFKEVLQKDGSIHHPWPLSPLKKKEKPHTSFLDLPLPEDDEDDDDDEYNPDKEIEMGSYSDEDSESVASSQVSDLGSPRPSTPATPSSSVSRFSDLDKTPSVQGDDEIRSPMGPPPRPLKPLSSHKTPLGKKFHMAMAESERKYKQKETETIALRTRSKLSLTDTSLVELESNFVAPDITLDMYDTSCDDREWMTFLTGLQKFPETEDTNDDENDPEYNYLAEAEEEEIDMEDFRCDRAVQVSRKEMNELMDELLEAYPDTDGLEDEEKAVLKKKAFDNAKQVAKESQRITAPVLDVGLNDAQRIQLGHQMRKHVQLLTQMYVIASGNVQDYQDVKENSKFLLNEIKKFSEVNSSLTGQSAYRVYNLDEAIELVNEDKQFVQLDPKNIIVNTRARIKKNPASPSKKGRKSAVEKDPSCLSPEKGIENMLCRNYKQLSERQKDLIYSVLGDGANFSEPSSILPKSTLPNLTVQQREIFWRSLIFIYPELIPHGSFLISRDLSKTSRVCFTDAEDSLLALGLEQFRNLPYFRRLIQKFMLPCKTEDQIKIRIKNLTSKNAPDNPVKKFKTEKKLPEFPVFAESFDANGIKPVMCQEAARLPTWCKEMKIREIIIMHDDDEGSYSIQRSSSVNIPVVCSKSIVIDTSKSKSAPTTPLNQHLITKSVQPSLEDSTPQNDKVSPIKQPQVVRPVQRSAQKSLMFDHVSSAESLSPKVTQLQNIGRKRCGSPGFIKLGESETEGQLASPLPDTLHSSQSFTFTAESRGVTPGSRARTPVHSVPSSVVSAQLPSEAVISNKKSNAIMIMHGQTPVTCATPTFVINKSSGTTVTGQIESTVLSTALPSSICSVVHTVDDCAVKPISPTKLIDNLSKEVHKEFTPKKVTPPKRAAEIVASYAPYYLSPELMKEPCLSQDAQEKTPNKKSPCSGRYRPVAPKPIVLSTFTSPVKKVSPFLEKKLKSPRRKQLQVKALSLRPKGFVPNPPHISPVKKAASNIINKALNKKPKVLLPKPYGMVSRPLHVHVRKSGVMIVNDEEEASLPEMATSESEGMETDYMSGDCIDTMDLDEAKVANKPSTFSKRQKHNSESNRSVESDDTQSEADNLYDSQNEDDVIDDEDHLADLMAASSTICFASQRQNAKDKENKKKGIKKKDATLAMLAPDLLEVDPHRDDKDIVFAQAYLNRTKEALKGDTVKYEQFLKILYDFGKSEQSPVKLYKDLQVLLTGYPELLSDFAGFLLPEQALECGCFKASQEFKRAKTFLRKLEVYLARHPSHYQKMMKIFSRWSLSETRNIKELREALEPMLKMQPHLMDELSVFFEDERPPESYLTDYEEITLDDSDTEPDPDGYEVIELPDEQDINGTKMCQCSCHKNTLDQNYLKRNRHCYSCCLKVIDGELYFRVSNKVLKKVNVIYHKPIKTRSREPTKPDSMEPRVSPIPPSTPAWLVDDPIAEKENVDISLLPKMFGSKKRRERSRFTSSSDSRSQESMIHTQDQPVLETYDDPTDTSPLPVSTEETSIKESSSSIVQSKPTSFHSESFSGFKDMGIVKQSISATNIKTTPSSVDMVTLEDRRKISHKQPNSGVEDSSSTVDIGVLGEERIISPKHTDLNLRVSASTIDFRLLGEEANISPKKSEAVEITSNSSSTFPYGGDSTTCPDILAKALKVAMICQGDVSVDVHCDNHNSIGFPGVKIISSPKTMESLHTKHSNRENSSGSGKHFVKELFASSSESSDSNTLKPTGTFTVNEDASNIGVIKSLDPSDQPENIICTLAREEDSSLSQFDSSRLCSNNTISKLPCVVEEENEHAETLSCSTMPLPTFGSSVPNILKESTQFLSVEIKTSTKKSGVGVKSSPFSCDEEQATSVLQQEHEDDYCRPSEPKSVEEFSRSSSRLSEPRVVDSPKSVISIIHPEIESSTIGFSADSNSSASSLQSTEINRLTPRRVAARSRVDNYNVSSKGDKSSPGSDREDKPTRLKEETLDLAGTKSLSENSSVWNRDTDRIILEAVKTQGPGSDTFIAISQQLPGKSPQQVSERFHQLLEILASEETPSEDDVEGNSSSN